jgi:hypothetical protein
LLAKDTDSFHAITTKEEEQKVAIHAVLIDFATGKIEQFQLLTRNPTMRVGAGETTQRGDR